MAYKDVFQMPNAVKITGRTSSITNAFINGIIPCIVPSEEEIKTALSILGMDEQTICCSYCGDKYTEWDHFRPLIKRKRATGFISEIHNLVPSCPKCNQSKGNSEWREWIVGPAKLSPTTRGIKNIDTKIARLSDFEKWGEPIKVDFESIVGIEKWEQHWRNCELLHEQMYDSQKLSDEIKNLVQAFISKETSPIQSPNMQPRVGTTTPTPKGTEIWSAQRVGLIAQTALRQILESKKHDTILLNCLQDKLFCKSTFDLNFPLLIKVSKNNQSQSLGVDHTGVNRYYKEPITINGEKYLLTSQWYDRNKPFLVKWLNSINRK